jgi:hypothetical protein
VQFAIEAAYFDGGVLTDDVFGFDLDFGSMASSHPPSVACR